MVKIYKDFFDTDCLKYIEEQIERSKKTNNFRTSYYGTSPWTPGIIQNSTPVMIYDMPDSNNGMLLKQLKEIIDIKTATFMIYYWPVGSYIPWHNDAHFKMTATLYCNKTWNRNWGGLFLYEEGDNVLAEVPEWNKLVVQTHTTWHSTTSVTKPYFGAVSDNGYGYKVNRKHLDMRPEIRTTIQIFEGKDDE